MKQQNDWYTGINHYDNALEKEIQVEEMLIKAPTVQRLHEQVELLYIRSGEGILSVNGCDYQMKEGALFCLYSHHLHHVSQIRVPLKAVAVRFYIGLFMYMSWEKHPRHANARLMYDTLPAVYPQGRDAQRLSALIGELLYENGQQRFESLNMMEYLTLELHAWYCRMAYEAINTQSVKGDPVWDILIKAVLGTGEEFQMEDAAASCGLSGPALNRRIRELSGYTIYQLRQFGKMVNACALLHFPELSMEYISELLNFPSVPSFYRAFKQYKDMTPREYQECCVLGTGQNEPSGSGTQNTALQFLQYLHIHVCADVKLKDMCHDFAVKEYTARRILETGFGRSFEELLADIRIRLACSLLLATDRSVLDIATECGFDSLVTFERHFRRCMDQTPSQYRK